MKWIMIIVMISLAISIWNTNNKVNDISDKIDFLQGSVNHVLDENGYTSYAPSLTDLKTEIDNLKLKCTPNPIGDGSLNCVIPN